MNLHKKLFPQCESEKDELRMMKTATVDRTALTEDEMRSLFSKNQEFFEHLLVETFIGHIPKDISEPALKIFKDQGEMFQRWILWQSHYINRKALHDAIHIPKYDGMMIYLKVLYTIADMFKASPSVPAPARNPAPAEQPWVDKAMGGLDEFREGHKRNGIQNDKTAEDETAENATDSGPKTEHNPV